MGIISRFADIMSANVNAVLSKAEEANADKLLMKFIQDAKDSLGQIKAETAAIIAEELVLARKLSDNIETQHKYENYSLTAVKRGDDNDAKKFITHQMSLAEQQTELQRQYAAAKENSEKMRQMTSKLISDIEVAQEKARELKMKLTIARRNEKLSKINGKLDSNRTGGVDNLFDTIQRKIDTADAMSILEEGLNSQSEEIEKMSQKYEKESIEIDCTYETAEDRLLRLKAGLNSNGTEHNI